MLIRIHPSPARELIATVGTLAALVTICVALFPSVSAAASPAVPVTPFLDCVHFNSDHGDPIYTGVGGRGPLLRGDQPAA